MFDYYEIKAILRHNILHYGLPNIEIPDCPSDAFATAASPGWVTGRAVAGRGIAPILGVAVAGGGTGKGTGIAD
jgi:hypothetical protein